MDLVREKERIRENESKIISSMPLRCQPNQTIRQSFSVYVQQKLFHVNGACLNFVQRKKRKHKIFSEFIFCAEKRSVRNSGIGLFCLHYLFAIRSKTTKSNRNPKCENQTIV